MQEQSQRQSNDILREISCLKCAHFPVCFYYRNIAPLLSIPELDEKKAERLRPFKAEDLAKICHFYAPDFPMA